MDCYGKYSHSQDNCHHCQYRLSCRYYANTEKKIRRREHIISFEAAQELLDCADCDHIPGDEVQPDHSAELISALGRFSVTCWIWMITVSGSSLK